MTRIVLLLLSACFFSSSAWSYFFAQPTPVAWSSPPPVGADGRPMTVAEEHTVLHFATPFAPLEQLKKSPTTDPVEQLRAHFYARSEAYSALMGGTNPLHALYLFNRAHTPSTHNDPFLDALFIPKNLFEGSEDPQEAWHNYSYSGANGKCSLVITAQFSNPTPPQSHIQALMQENFFTMQPGANLLTPTQRALLFEFVFAHEFAHCFFTSHFGAPQSISTEYKLAHPALAPYFFHPKHAEHLHPSQALLLRLHVDRADPVAKQFKELQADSLALFFLHHTQAQPEDLRVVLDFIFAWRSQREKMLTTELTSVHLGGLLHMQRARIQHMLQQDLPQARAFFSTTLPMELLLSYYDQPERYTDFLSYFAADTFSAHLAGVLIDVRTKNIFALDYLQPENQKYQILFTQQWARPLWEALQPVGAHVEHTQESSHVRIALYHTLARRLLPLLPQ